MATIVCQSGLQSCLESQIVEPRTLRLRLSSPRVPPHLSEPLELTFKSCFLDSNTKPTLEEIKCRSDHHHEKPQDQGARSFLEAITNGCQLESNISDKDQNTYVHPLSKRSLSALSDKSLELCTENLGSETGTDIIEDSIFSMSDSSSSSSSSDSESGDFQTREQRKSHQLLRTKKASNNCHNFPPPLTTIRGLESLQVRTHREDGRLIIKAVKNPSTPSLFKAERSHGRLRLSFFKDFEEPEQQQQQEQQEMVTDETTLDDEDDSTTQQQEDFENKEEEEEEENKEDDENGAYREKEDMDGNNLEVEGKIGIKKIQRTGRCKESESAGGDNKNIGLLLNWEPFWVATS
ncbi:hypothetical protein Ddye_022143 [Dipteronia dyeriana]|uniref:FAF domain-containing protein n=1 Tax=Dipteronia dyeriana TaxID=168575 RepID=A0AAD9U3N0_9ROSI|nr:hypothetical protein Ddye_022143 [Dipteronia dyeriana]